jgi:hypothetical protein
MLGKLVFSDSMQFCHHIEWQQLYQIGNVAIWVSALENTEVSGGARSGDCDSEWTLHPIFW